MAFRVSTETRGDRVVHRLHDDNTGAQASILPSYGLNLFDLSLPVAGRIRPLVVTEPGWEAHPRNPGRNGVPILFPFPNRIRDARYRFQGRDYALFANKPPHAIHGFAIDAAWDVLDHAADDTSAWITGRFQISRQAPRALTSWPTDAVLQVRYRLRGESIVMEIVVSNPTDEPLPFGFGIHSYFRLPLDPSGRSEHTRLVIPATRYWVLEGMLPTGERRPVDERLDFRDGKPIGTLALDDVLTDLRFDGEFCDCRLVDLALGAEIRLRFDRMFREVVLFTPPGDGGTVAVEPYTQTTDAINLADRGVDSGLRVLGPQQSVPMSIVVAAGPIVHVAG